MESEGRCRQISGLTNRNHIRLEYAEVSVHSRIAENNGIITDFQTDKLLEQILQRDNLNKAYKKAIYEEQFSENSYGFRPKRGAHDALKRCQQNVEDGYIMQYIEGKLYLKVNLEKTKVAHVSKVKYLGYSFYRYKGKCRLTVHPKSVAKMKEKLKILTSRSNGWGNEYRTLKLKQFIRGWVNYFSLADMKDLLRRTDEWLRRKIRAVYWKQWKKIKTKYRMIKKFGMPDWKVHELANCRKGIWRSAIMLNSVLTIKVIASLGYISMTDYYLKICEN